MTTEFNTTFLELYLFLEKKKKKNLEAQMHKYTQTHMTFNMWHVP